MIIVLKPRTTEENIIRVENMIKRHGLDTHTVRGAEMTIIGCIGDTTSVDSKLFEVDTCVDKVMHVQEPYKLANRAFHPEDSVIDVSGVKIGGGHMGVIAGPCSVESFDQVLEIAKAAKAPAQTCCAAVRSSHVQARTLFRGSVWRDWIFSAKSGKKSDFRS